MGDKTAAVKYLIANAYYSEFDSLLKGKLA